MDVPVPESVIQARGRDPGGRTWFQVQGNTEGLLVDGGRTPRPVGPPGGIHRQPRAVFKYWRRSCDSQLKFHQSKKVKVS